jgi:hypothetical protein
MIDMTDKEEKIGWGYRTAATGLQDKFEELSAKAERKEKDWRDLRVHVESIKEGTQRELLGSKEKGIALFPMATYFQHLIEMSVICLLGESMAKIEARLVELEKSIAKLDLKVK